MKKWLSLFLAAILVMGLSACASLNEDNQTADFGMATSQEETEEQEPSENKNDESEQPVNAVENRVLIVYYSYSGVTEGISERLQEKTDGDLFELVPAEAYSEDMYEASDRAEEERKSGNLPELVGQMPDLGNYDMVLVGGPVWSETLAPPVMSYLEQNDFAGKTVAPFWTYNNNEGGYEEDARSQIRNADLRDGLGLSKVSSYEESDLNQVLDDWLEALGAVSSDRQEDAKETNIRITIGDSEIKAVLNNSEAAAEFKEMLPVTVSMTRMGEHEYYGSLEKPLTHTTDLQTGYTVGDLAFWTPGDLFAMYFDEPENDPEGLMILGRITTDLSVFDSLGSPESVSIELDD